MLSAVKPVHREAFNCVVNHMNWDNYIMTVGAGVRTFLLNEWICRWEPPGGFIDSPESRGERTVKQLNGGRALVAPTDPSGFDVKTQLFEKDSYGMGPGPKIARAILLIFVAIAATLYYVNNDVRTALEICAICWTIHMLI